MTYRVLSTGAIVWLDENRAATFERCTWLVRIPSGHPEPDSFADTFLDVDCGAIVRSPDGTWDRTVCDNGHTRYAMGTPEWAADLAVFERAQKAAEADGFDPHTSLAHVA